MNMPPNQSLQLTAVPYDDQVTARLRNPTVKISVASI
jgi:hypothetical protein